MRRWRFALLRSGEGLGKDGTGIKKCIVIKKKDNEEGVGAACFRDG